MWNWEAPEGAGDFYEAAFRGSKARIELRQGKEQHYVPELYVVPNSGSGRDAVFENLKHKVAALQRRYPGLAIEQQAGEARLVIPERFRVGHEEHFAQVTRRFFEYVKAPQTLPSWEKVEHADEVFHHYQRRGVGALKRKGAHHFETLSNPYAAGGRRAFAQQAVPEIPFDSVPDFLKLPADLYLGEAAGRRGQFQGPRFCFLARQHHRAGLWRDRRAIAGVRSRRQVHPRNRQESLRLVFRPRRPHRQGRQYLGRRQRLGHDHQVQSAKAAWRWCSGARRKPPTKRRPVEHANPPRPPVDGQFRQPTDVTWDPAGNIFISDGYINSRVAKFDKNGDWVKSVGRARQRAGPVQHAAQHCRRREGQHLCRRPRQPPHPGVRSRRKRFCAKSKSMCPPRPMRASGWAEPGPGHQLTMQPGSPWASALLPGPLNICTARTHFPGRIYKLTLDGKVARMLGSTGHQPKQFGWIHEIACPSENELYVAELSTGGYRKLILHPAEKRAVALNDAG